MKNSTSQDKQFADQILGLLAKDAEVLVRRAMSVTLKNSPNLPRDVALKLAQDVESVACRSSWTRRSSGIQIWLNWF